MTNAFDTYIEGLLSEVANRAQQKYQHLLAQLTPEQIEAGREWISDCEWGNLDPEDIKELTPLEIVRGVDKHYEGGWSEFLSAA